MSVTMRDAFGKKLEALGAVNKKLVVLDADVSGSTKSSYFGKAFPDRFFNCGVAEGNMAGVAAGLATAGFHPVINAFAIFIALKTADQIRHDFCYNKLPVVIAGAYGGLSDSFDGASHQAIADIAIMRAFPNMEVIVPGDNKQAELALDYALLQHHPVYIRLSRNDTPEIPVSEGFTSKAPILLKTGSDVTLAATGLTAQITLEAAALLEKDGIKAEVFSVPFVKPIEGDSLEKSVQKTHKLVTVEEHSVVGGFGSACLEKLTKSGVPFTWVPIGVQDTFGDTGGYAELLAAYGLSAEKIAEKVKGK
ncbi:1-deoxy-D-xylulose-5-phosphate synthase [Treponema primitia]|uniref:transketolase family protein n=1 Tax=Treponema primitia TaxID=88058 RepID=UPI0039806980